MIKLRLERTYKGVSYTIGKLYLNDKYFCDTLEDKDRGLKSTMSKEEIEKIKVYSQTAIPTGTYKVDMNTVSPKFKDRVWARPYGGKLPRLIDVKGYSGVLIHVGNKPEDTLGCILVGENKVKGQVINSIAAFNRLMAELKKDKDIELTIE